jgi:hypothetical protein
MQLMRQRTKNVRVNASSVACTLRFPVIPETGQAHGLPWIWVERGDLFQFQQYSILQCAGPRVGDHLRPLSRARLLSP